jgi:NCS1 family nucleobase:cation symporter-1
VNERDPSLYSEDLRPTTEEERTWSHWHIAALWVGMAVCIPTYGLAAGLVAAGASLELAVTSVAIGNLIVLVPLILNGHPGAKYGIPFPVLIRSSFGPVGAHIPTMVRALVACGWFGIQTWIGGKALAYLAVVAFPQVHLPQFLPGFFGITTGQFLAFGAFWALNVVIIVRGIEALKIFETLAAPFLLGTGLLLFVWAWLHPDVGSLSTLLSDASHLLPAEQQPEGAPSTFAALGTGITVAVAFWGTLALNIPDFTRYAKSQKAQALGQAISLPTTMTFYVFIGAAVTNATILIFGERIGDPVEVLSQVGGPVVVIIAMLGLIIATLSTNLAANVVSPANGFANLAPRVINFRRGALITAGLGFVIFPWKMWESSAAYVNAWLGGCGGLLGAVGGIMIADYFVIRKTELDIDDLYRRGGRYEFSSGFNPVALVAFVLGVAPLLPGFLGTIKLMQPPQLLADLYIWSWFVAFFVAGGLYVAGMTLRRSK